MRNSKIRRFLSRTRKRRSFGGYEFLYIAAVPRRVPFTSSTSPTNQPTNRSSFILLNSHQQPTPVFAFAFTGPLRFVYLFYSP